MKKSTEDYLKIIRILQAKNGTVRSKEIAAAAGVTRPSVSWIVKRLSAEGFITVGKNYSIELTQAGLSVAEEMLERNRVIRNLLIRLGVEESVAEADACEMEHIVSPQSLAALKALAESVNALDQKQNA